MGNPPQELRLLPSFFGTTVTPIDANKCRVNPCPSESGLLYNNSKSITWEAIDLGSGGAPLGMSSSNWSYEAQSIFGKDDIGIKTDRELALNIAKASFVTPIFDFVRLSTGMLGLNNRRNNKEPDSSVIDRIVQQNGLDVSAWFYTAGSSAANATGSLILGGYDQSRMDPKPGLMISQRKMTLPESYYVFLAQIGNSSGGLLYPAGTLVHLNSDTTQIWLSDQTCKNFEAAYGLVW